MNIFIRVSTLTGRIVQTQEDPVSRDFPIRFTSNL